MTVQIVVILDESSSMTSKRSETIDGYNKFIEEQREAGEDAEVTLVTFSNSVRIVFFRIPIKDVKLLTEEGYHPNGYTALLDSIGETITQFEHIQTNFPNSMKGIIISITTDGDENSSNKFNKFQIKELTTRMEKEHNWKFIYAGADQDAFSIGSGMGISTAYNFKDDAHGVGESYKFLARSTASYRSSVGNISTSAAMDIESKNVYDINDGNNNYEK